MAKKTGLLRSISLIVLLTVLIGILPAGPVWAAPEEKPKKEPTRVKELTELKTNNSKTFLNEDGSHTAEISILDIQSKGSGDKWQELDQKVRVKNGKFIAKGSLRVVEFGSGTDVALASAADEADRIMMSLAGAAKATAQADGDYAVIYPDVLEDVDLRYTVTGRGLKEDIILKTAGAAREFAFDIDTPGLEYISNSGSASSRFVDRSSKTAFFLSPLVMYDASGKHCSDIELKVETAGSKTRLVIVPSAAFLDSPETAYPVTVDPSVVIPLSHPDTKERALVGGAGSLSLTGQYISEEENITGQCYIQFPLPVPKGTITSAKLRLYLYSRRPSWYSVDNFVINMRECQGSWTEGGSSIPPLSSVISTLTFPASSVLNYRWSEWDITSTLQKWLNGSLVNNGLSFIGNAYVDGIPLGFNSTHTADPAYWPKLTVTYTPDYSVTFPGADVPVSMNAGDTYNAEVTVTNR